MVKGLPGTPYERALAWSAVRGPMRRDASSRACVRACVKYRYGSPFTILHPAGGHHAELASRRAEDGRAVPRAPLNGLVEANSGLNGLRRRRTRHEIW